MNELITQLQELYPEVRFEARCEKDKCILVYNNRDLLWDEKFQDDVFNIAEKTLSKDEQKGFTFLYDFLNELSYTLEDNLECKAEYTVLITKSIGSYRFTVEKETNRQMEIEESIYDIPSISKMFFSSIAVE